jgi:hypothetical protein
MDTCATESYMEQKNLLGHAYPLSESSWHLGNKCYRLRLRPVVPGNKCYRLSRP